MVLVTPLAQSAVDVLDEILLLFDQAVSAREAAAKQKVTEALAERATGGENRPKISSTNSAAGRSDNARIRT